MARYNFNNIEYPSVTQILNMLDKSNALIPWAVNNTIKYIKQNSKHNDVVGEIYEYIIEPDTLKEAKTEFRNISKEAMDIGSQTHDLIECYIKHDKDKSFMTKYPDEVQNAFLAFLDWEKENNVEWLECEQSIVSKHFGYAGTLDAIAIVNGKITVIDFKTGKAIYPEAIKQIASYFYARKECNNEKTTLLKNFDDVISTEEIKYNSYEITNAGILRLDKNTGLPEYKDFTKKIDNQYEAFLKLLEFYYLDKKRRLKNNPFV